MAHGHALHIDVDEVKLAGTIQQSSLLHFLFQVLLGAGVLVTMVGLFIADPKRLWTAYYTNLLFWMGLGAGGVMVTAIFQIVRARWSAPIRRIAEANVSFLPCVYLAFLFSYFGREHLFPWGKIETPMPGREFWMQPGFVYARFSVLLFILFFMMWRYVRLSLRSDIGTLQADGSVKTDEFGGFYGRVAANWKGAKEIGDIQRRLSNFAPLLVLVYVVVYSLFAFEMIMGMDKVWYSNMFGGFIFVANINMGWTILACLTIYFARKHRIFGKSVSTNQLWDLGKLMFGFCMLWGYLFFSQYLPQWYGNMPEETQWLLLRTKGLWQPFSYVVFGSCFIVPFVMLLSEDVKKTPVLLTMVGSIILLGNWLMYYVLVAPQLFPNSIPLLDGALWEIGIFMGFLGAYGLSIQNFMKHVPFIAFSHPMAKGSIDW